MSLDPSTSTVAVPRRSSARAAAAPVVRVLGCFRGTVTLGGLERMMIEAARAVTARGAVVHMVFSRMTEPAVLDAARQAGATWSISADRGRLRRGAAALVSNAWEALRSSALLLSAAWRFAPSHLLVPEFGVVFDQWLGLALLRMRGQRVVLALQNAPLITARYRRLWRWIIDPVVDTYVCASHACERSLLAFGVRPDKIRVVYNAPPPRAPIEGDVPVRTPGRVIYVGQIIPAKGLDLLLEAIGILVARGLDVTLDVVGRHDGWIAPEYEAFRANLFMRAARPDLTERVRFLGFCEDVPARMAAATVHCIPSRPEMCEGFGIVVAEAKQMGVPSVAFNHGPFPELIEHRRTGWLCDEHTAEGLAEGLQFFLANDPHAAAQLTAAVRSSASRFTMEAFARGWRDAFAGTHS